MCPFSYLSIHLGTIIGSIRTVSILFHGALLDAVLLYLLHSFPLRSLHNLLHSFHLYSHLNLLYGFLLGAVRVPFVLYLSNFILLGNSLYISMLYCMAYHCMHNSYLPNITMLTDSCLLFVPAINHT